MIARKTCFLGLLLAGIGSQAATVTNNLSDCVGNPAGITYVRFLPKSTPLPNGGSIVLDTIKWANVDTNGNFGITNLIGGNYEVDFSRDTPNLLIRIPFGDTNTYSLVQCASLYTSGLLFYTNGWDRISSRVTGAAVTSTNNPGSIYESLVVSGGSGGGVTNTDLMTQGETNLFWSIGTSNSIQAQIAAKVSTNDSRNLVFTGTTNNLGGDVSATKFWGDAGGLTGISLPAALTNYDTRLVVLTNLSITNGLMQIGSSTFDSMAIGNSAGRNSMGKYGNTAVGVNALQNNTNGAYNTVLGRGAMSAATNANYNTAIGWGSMNVNQSDRNTAVGYNSMYYSRDAEYNVAVGGNVLYDGLHSARNAAIGYEALTYGSNVTDSVAIGFRAGSHISGYASPYTSKDDEKVVFLGAQSGREDELVGVGLTNAIAIGYLAKAPTNNTAVIGGTGANAVSLIIYSNMSLPFGGASYYGLIGSGAVTNGSGSRVAYLADITGGSATNAIGNLDGQGTNTTIWQGLTSQDNFTNKGTAYFGSSGQLMISSGGALTGDISGGTGLTNTLGSAAWQSTNDFRVHRVGMDANSGFSFSYGTNIIFHKGGAEYLHMRFEPGTQDVNWWNPDSEFELMRFAEHDLNGVEFLRRNILFQTPDLLYTTNVATFSNTVIRVVGSWGGFEGNASGATGLTNNLATQSYANNATNNLNTALTNKMRLPSVVIDGLTQGQSIRRTASDAWEGYTPGTGSGSTNITDGWDYKITVPNVTVSTNLTVSGTLYSDTNNAGTLVVTNALAPDVVSDSAGATNLALRYVDASTMSWTLIGTNMMNATAHEAYMAGGGGVTAGELQAATNTGNYITANGNPTTAQFTASTNTGNYITANGNLKTSDWTNAAAAGNGVYTTSKTNLVVTGQLTIGALDGTKTNIFEHTVFTNNGYVWIGGVPRNTWPSTGDPWQTQFGTPALTNLSAGTGTGLTTLLTSAVTNALPDTVRSATNGLGSAAFTASTAYDAAGTAQTATNSLNTALTNKMRLPSVFVDGMSEGQSIRRTASDAWEAFTPGAGSQTPWAQDINAAGYVLTNLAGVGVTNTANAGQGIWSGSKTNLTVSGGLRVGTWITNDALQANMIVSTDANKVLTNGSVATPLTFSQNLLSMPVANTSQDGYLTTADWDTFNDKASTAYVTTATNELNTALTNKLRLPSAFVDGLSQGQSMRRTASDSWEAFTPSVGSPAFSEIGNGTATSKTFAMGAGSVLDTTGGGKILANALITNSAATNIAVYQALTLAGTVGSGEGKVVVLDQQSAPGQMQTATGVGMTNSVVWANNGFEMGWGGAYYGKFDSLTNAHNQGINYISNVLAVARINSTNNLVWVLTQTAPIATNMTVHTNLIVTNGAFIVHGEGAKIALTNGSTWMVLDGNVRIPGTYEAAFGGAGFAGLNTSLTNAAGQTMSAEILQKTNDLNTALTNKLWNPAYIATSPTQGKVPRVAAGNATWEWADMAAGGTWTTDQNAGGYSLTNAAGIGITNTAAAGQGIWSSSKTNLLVSGGVYGMNPTATNFFTNTFMQGPVWMNSLASKTVLGTDANGQVADNTGHLTGATNNLNTALTNKMRLPSVFVDGMSQGQSIRRTASDAWEAFTPGTGGTVTNTRPFSFAAPTSSENVMLFYTKHGITIDDFRGAVKGASASVTFNIAFASTRNTASSNLVFSANQTLDQAAGEAFTPTDTTIDAGSYVWFVSTATSGTVEDANLTITYY